MIKTEIDLLDFSLAGTVSSGLHEKPLKIESSSTGSIKIKMLFHAMKIKTKNRNIILYLQYAHSDDCSIYLTSFMFELSIKSILAKNHENEGSNEILPPLHEMVDVRRGRERCWVTFSDTRPRHKGDSLYMYKYIYTYQKYRKGKYIIFYTNRMNLCDAKNFQAVMVKIHKN